MWLVCVVIYRGILSLSLDSSLHDHFINKKLSSRKETPRLLLGSVLAKYSWKMIFSDTIRLSSTTVTYSAYKAIEFGEITQNKGYYAVRGHSRSSRSVSIESSYATSHHRQRSMLYCSKAHAKINSKMEKSIPCKIVTPKIFNLKLRKRTYVKKTTNHANFGFNQYSGDFSPNRRNITTLWVFWLSGFFFSRERAQVEQWTDFHALRRCLLGVRTMCRHLEEMSSNLQKWPWINNFKPKRRNIKIAVSWKIQIRSTPKLRTQLRPTIALHRYSNIRQIFRIGTVRYAEGLWRMRRHGPVIAHCTDSEDFPNIIQIKSNMAAARHLEKIYMTS